MSASGILAGKAFVRIGADAGPLNKALARVQKKLSGLGQRLAVAGAGLTAAGSAITAPLILAAKHFASFGSELLEASQRTGITVEALSELDHAAKQSGLSLADLELGIKGMNKAIVAAKGGSLEAVQALRLINLTADDLLSMNPEQQFMAIAEGIMGISDPTLRAVVAMRLLGKAGKALLPMMEGGAAGIEELREEARRLGLTVTAEQAKNADILGDAWDNLTASFKAAAFQVGAALAPALIKIAGIIQPLVTGVINFIKANTGLVTTVALVGVALAAAGAALVGLAATVAIVGTAVGMLAAALAAIVAIPGMILAAAGAVAGAIGGLLALIFSPIGLAVGLIAALGYAFFTMTEIGRSALTALSETVTGFAQTVSDSLSNVIGMLTSGLPAAAETAKAAFQGIKDALAAGNWALAAQIAWTGIKLAFLQGTMAIRKRWIEVSVGLMDTWDAVVGGITSLWQGLVTKIAGWLIDMQMGLGRLLFHMGSVPGIAKILGAKTAEAWKQTGVDLQTAAAGARPALEEDAARASARREFDRRQRMIERRQAAGEDTKALEEELRALKEEFQKATDEAKAGAPPGVDTSPLQQRMPAIAREVAGETTAAGAFSAAAAARLGGAGGIGKQQLDALIDIRDEQEKTNNLLRDPKGLVFV